mmetsp:Transcript_1377/g.1554  ORF Transcript_1377/g.1554 Transcript_1377/m.1554 type:complete len:152 (+) Transcript_1377:176-631(+)
MIFDTITLNIVHKIAGDKASKYCRLATCGSSRQNKAAPNGSPKKAAKPALIPHNVIILLVLLGCSQHIPIQEPIAPTMIITAASGPALPPEMIDISDTTSIGTTCFKGITPGPCTLDITSGMVDVPLKGVYFHIFIKRPVHVPKTSAAIQL